MRASCSRILLGLLPTLLGGCVVFPHGDLVAPAAGGTVLDAETLEPVWHAKVIREIERPHRTRVVFTDGRGAFAFKQDKDLGWLVAVEYAASRIQYRIDTEGYCPFQTNLYGGGSLYRGTLPHDLGVVLLQKQKVEGDAADGSHPVGPEANRASPEAALPR